LPAEYQEEYRQEAEKAHRKQEAEVRKQQKAERLRQEDEETGQRNESRSYVDQCERCGSTGDGKAYRFFFGKWLSTDERLTFGGKEVKSMFRMGGSTTVFLCSKCVFWRRQLPMLTVAIVWSLAFAVTLLIGLVWHLQVLQAIAALLGLLSVFGVFAPLMEAGNVGYKLAIETKRAAYIASGFDSFFTPEDAERLKSR
jgi:hypothetical protein